MPFNHLNHKDGLDLFIEDKNFEQDGINEALSDIFRTLFSSNTSTGTIVQGYDCRISTLDNTKIEIYHNNVHGIGQAVNGLFQYIVTSTGVDSISLADSTFGVTNILAINYDETLTNNRINIVTGINNPTRIARSWQYQVFTLAQWTTAVTSTGWTEIGRVIAQGSGQPLTSIDTTHVVHGFLTEDMLSSLFNIYQTMVRNSTVYDDTVATSTGWQNNLQDDLNQLRAIIKEMKGTASYTDLSPGSLGDFDRDVTALHGNGVLDGVLNEFAYTQPTPSQISIATGKAIINGYVPRTTSTGTFTFDNPTSPLIVNEVQQFTGGVLNLNEVHTNIASLVVTTSSGSVISPSLYHVSDSSTSEITSDGLADSVNFYFTYSYNQQRYDIAQISNTSIITIKQGTQFDYLSYGIVPTVDTNNLLLYKVLVQGDVTATAVITDMRVFVSKTGNIKRQIFTSNGTWYKPTHIPGYMLVKVLMVGAGGKGGDAGAYGGGAGLYSPGGGGGGGAGAVQEFIDFTNSDLNIIVGLTGNTTVAGLGSTRIAEAGVDGSPGENAQPGNVGGAGGAGGAGGGYGAAGGGGGGGGSGTGGAGVGGLGGAVTNLGGFGQQLPGSGGSATTGEGGNGGYFGSAGDNGLAGDTLSNAGGCGGGGAAGYGAEGGEGSPTTPTINDAWGYGSGGGGGANNTPTDQPTGGQGGGGICIVEWIE